MAIRCATKAIIVENGAILLNRCKGEDGDIYYDLPGGGQKQYESMERTVVREVKEETGYEVSVERFVALAEEINLSAEYREKYPEYTHRVLHVFTAKLKAQKRDVPTEKDFGMEESVWMPLEKLDDNVKTRPGCLKEILHRIAEKDVPVYLGTEYIDRY
ncbi:MAG: NUDIX domain-containing protein [Lachnospiraceae bacterium]|nr:NUDIX domain-containing protein [Lachnospiraceae bacterium]